jgi:hypothetical protein
MSLHCFVIPALDPRAAQAELNVFCAAHRVLSLERQFVLAAHATYWSERGCFGPNALPCADFSADLPV